jgi:hypothetical protein
MHPLSVRLLCASPLPVRAQVLSTPTRGIALALCSPRPLSGLIEVTPSLTAPLRATLLTPPHRHRHDQNDKHHAAATTITTTPVLTANKTKTALIMCSPSALPFLQHIRLDRHGRPRFQGFLATSSVGATDDRVAIRA